MRRWTTLLAMFVAVAAVPQSGGDAKALQDQLNRLARERQQTNRKLAETREEKREVRVDLRQVDNQLASVQRELNTTRSKLSATRAEQRSLGRELVAANERLDELTVQVRERLNRMYRQGSTQPVTALVGVRDIGELASRKYIFERVARHDRKIFAEYEALLKKTAEDKRRADALVSRIASLQEQQASQQQRLAGARQEKSRVLSQLSSQERELERALQQMERESASIQSKIAAYYSTGKPSPRKFSGRFIRPAAGPQTSGYGMRRHPILKKSRMHNGIDIGAKSGSPIFAAGAGKVIFAAYGSGYGNYIVIDHGDKISTLYGHCSRLLVSAGQEVRQGQRIALVGSTGLSTGPHLHFEVRVNGKPVNPASYLG